MLEQKHQKYTYESDIIKTNNRIKISGCDEYVLQLTESTLRSDHH